MTSRLWFWYGQNTCRSANNVCIRKSGRAVDCTGLENRRPFTGTVSSNLTSSATPLENNYGTFSNLPCLRLVIPFYNEGDFPMDHVTAVFETRLEAEEALEKLEAIGVTANQISLLATDETRGQHFNIENSTKAEEGATTGAILGGLAAAVAAAFTSAGAVAIPGLNIIVSGYLVSALAGAGAGATAGGLLGALVGLGFDEHEAKMYDEEVRSGNILLAVNPADSAQRKRIKEILDDSLEHEARLKGARSSASEDRSGFRT
jgi:hypothetical protein